MIDHRRRDGRILLATSALLLCVFFVLWVMQKRRGDQPHSPPAANLGEGWAAAALVEEAPPTPSAWPQWRGPTRDGVASGDGLRHPWPEKGPPLLWQKNIGESY